MIFLFFDGGGKIIATSGIVVICLEENFELEYAFLFDFLLGYDVENDENDAFDNDDMDDCWLMS